MLQHRISDLDIYLFGRGTHYTVYEKLGAHPASENGQDGVYFAVWAPNARSVSVVGDFNGWTAGRDRMQLLAESGIYDLFIPGLGTHALYKFAIETQKGDVLFKADPYGNQCQLRPETASVVANLSSYDWQDGAWMGARLGSDPKKRPLSIYEVHLGSWKKDESGANCGFRKYRDLAPELAEYVNYMGYTHVELMGIAEHPFDGSWGYQVTGYYAPTARYGDAEDFMYMIDYLHQHGIGVILDWVPAHFPRDAYGLARFDGFAEYEHADPRQGEHPDWGTYIFNYRRPQVKNFLIANALFWLEKFHVDGLRVDAVASMLYLDYGKKDGEWVANEDGGNINYDAIEFLKHLNSIVGQRVPGAMVIAEESTAFPLVSRPPEDGGLGFTFKWNMGWMHDVLEYLKVDPIGRQHVHNNVTFSFTYAFSENYVLPFSHDEVVHLKCSMINKMPGNMEDKFGNLRLAYGLMMAHPGKKLLFMGQDFAQLREWSEERSLDWYLLDNEPAHRALNNYTRALLEMYRSYPSLYENDCEPCGFEWINGADAQHNMLSFCRISSDKKKCLLFHFNFSPVAYPKHRIGALCKGTYRQVLNSDDAVFGGSGNYPAQTIKADPIPWDGKEYSVEFDVPPYSVTAFAFNWTQPVGKKAAAEKTAQKKTTVKVSPARKETGKAVKSRTSKKAEEEKKTAILKAVEGSSKSLDEILAFLQK